MSLAVSSIVGGLNEKISLWINFCHHDLFLPPLSPFQRFNKMAIIANNVIFDVLTACCVSLINEVFLCNTRNCFTFAIQYNFHFLCFHLFPFFLKYHFKGSHSSQTVILNSCHTDRNCSCFTGLLHGKSVSFLVIEHWSSLSGNRDHALF